MGKRIIHGEIPTKVGKLILAAVAIHQTLALETFKILLLEHILVTALGFI
jgi:hypothetical protein